MPKLTSSLPVPPLRVIHTSRRPDPHFRKIPHRILRLRQPSHRRLPRPQIRLRITLLQYAFRTGQVPSAERELGLVFFLHGGFGVPGDGLAGVDGTAELAVLEGAAEAVLGEFVPEIGGLHKELEGVSFVADKGVGWGSTFVEERLGVYQSMLVCRCWALLTSSCSA